MNRDTTMIASQKTAPTPPLPVRQRCRWRLLIVLMVLAGCEQPADVKIGAGASPSFSVETTTEASHRSDTTEAVGQTAGARANSVACPASPPDAGTAPGGRGDPERLARALDKDEVRRWLAVFLERKFLSGAGHEGAFYMWADSVAYQLRGDGRPRFEIAVTEVPVARDEQQFVRALFRLRVTAAGWTVSLKPATFEVEDFPALLPWSPATEVPTAEYLVEYPVDDVETFYWSRPMQENMLLAKDRNPGEPRLWGDEQGQWLASLRPLEEAERIKLLNLDQGPLLSSEAKSKYAMLKDAFPRMVLPLDESYLVLHEDLLDSTGNYRLNAELGSHRLMENGGSANDLLRDLAYDGIYPINASYLVTELRDGTHQLWLVEQPLADIDRINGVSFRGQAYLAVRGYVRGRYLVVRKAYLDEGPPRVDVAGSWSDWIEPETRIGTFRIIVKDGETAWLNNAERRPVHVGEPTKRSLEEWCVPEDIKEMIKATIAKGYVQYQTFKLPR